jgi:hypothetical protein
MTLETDPNELAGLLVVDPKDDKGGDGGAGSSDKAPDAGKDGDGAAAGDADRKSADTDWNDAGDASGTGDTPTDDAAGDQAGEGEGQDDAQPGEANTEPFYTVTIDGKEEKVSLKEALEGYQRLQDYTRKTQDVAERRRTADAELEQARGTRAEYERVLKVLSERLGTERDDRTPEQWDKLRQEAPEQYAVEWTDHQRRLDARKAVKEEQDRVANERKIEANNQLREFVRGQKEQLFSKMSDWKTEGRIDPKKVEAGMKEIRSYASQAFGFSDQELDQAYDHRMILMADKARKYDALIVSQEKARKKLADAPTMQAPGSREPARSRQTAARQDAQKRFEKSGSVDDAVPLLFK